MLEQKRVVFDIDSISDEGAVVGYASIFGNVDGGGDVVLPGAFKKSLSARGSKPVKMLWNHFESFPIGKWTVLEEDTKGLRVEGRFTMASPKAQEIYALTKDGVIDAMSIGYRTVAAETDETTGIRRLKELDLWEVSLVTFPMNTEAMVEGVKGEGLSIDRLREMTERDIEAVLTGKRDAGRLSRTAAHLLMKGGLPAIHAKRDAGDEAAAQRMLERILHEIRAAKGVQL